MLGDGRKGMGSLIGLVLALSLLFAGASLVYHQLQVQNAVEFNMDDIDTISEASMYGDYMTDDYLKQSMRLAESEGVYQVTRDETLGWETEVIERGSPIRADLKQGVSDVLGNFIVKADRSIGCDLRMTDWQESFGLDSERSSRVSITPGGNVTCESESVTSSYNIPGPIVSEAQTRIFEMIEYSREFAIGLQGEEPEDPPLPKEVDEKTSEVRGISCNEDWGNIQSNVESIAKSDAKQDLIDRIGSSGDDDLIGVLGGVMVNVRQEMIDQNEDLVGEGEQYEGEGTFVLGWSSLNQNDCPEGYNFHEDYEGQGPACVDRQFRCSERAPNGRCLDDDGGELIEDVIELDPARESIKIDLNSDSKMQPLEERTGSSCSLEDFQDSDEDSDGEEGGDDGEDDEISREDLEDWQRQQLRSPPPAWIKGKAHVDELFFDYDIRNKKEEVLTSDGAKNIILSSQYNHEFEVNEAEDY